MPRTTVKSEDGFAVAAILVILLAVGTVVGATLHLAPVSTRAAIREQQSVQALANAESGLAYALAWLDSEAFDPSQLSGSAPVVIVADRKLGEGGYRNVTIEPRAGSEYLVAATGYQAGPGGREVTRRVQTAVRITSRSSGALFPRHWLSFPAGYENDPNHPANDPNDPAYGYEVIDVTLPSWTMPEFGPQVCSNVNKTSRDVINETCRWTGRYQLDWNNSPAAIENANMTVYGDMHITSGWRLDARDSVIGVTGSLTIDGSSPADLENVTIYVDGNMTIATDRHRMKVRGDTTVYVKGDLTIRGDASMEIFDGATFYVGGHVSIQGSGWTLGASGPEAPWIVIHVCKSLRIEGGAGAGAPIPDVAFVLDTTSPQCQNYPVTLAGSGSLYGGIYAPTRVVTVESASPVVGSLIGKQLNIPAWRHESDFERDYLQHEERMQSFTLTTASSSESVERLPEWRELR